MREAFHIARRVRGVLENPAPFSCRIANAFALHEIRYGLN